MKIKKVSDEGQDLGVQHEETNALTDENVLSYLNEKGHEVDSIDKLFEQKEPEINNDVVLNYLNKDREDKFNTIDEIYTPKKEEYPEHIKGFMEFHNKTSGSFEDYVELNKKYEGDDALRFYYEKQHPNLNKEEIDFLMNKFSINEDDYESETELEIAKKEIGINKKTEIEKANKYIEDYKGEYYKALESNAITKEDRELLQKTKQSIEMSKSQMEAAKKANELFVKQSMELLSDSFKGFDVKVGDKEMLIEAKADEVIKQNNELSSFVTKYADKEGNIKDVKGYHKALFFANNPELIANHFYEQGKADAIANNSKTKGAEVRTAAPNLGGSKPKIKRIN